MIFRYPRTSGLIDFRFGALIQPLDLTRLKRYGVGFSATNEGHSLQSISQQRLTVSGSNKLQLRHDPHDVGRQFRRDHRVANRQCNTTHGRITQETSNLWVLRV